MKRAPQWQKSEETINRFDGSARYGASALPYSASLQGRHVQLLNCYDGFGAQSWLCKTAPILAHLAGVSAPTMMGTSVTGCDLR